MKSTLFSLRKKVREMKKHVIFLSLVREKNIKFCYFPSLVFQGKKHKNTLFSLRENNYPPKGGYNVPFP